MKRKLRIGILGGTFNPPHFGHLAIAQETLYKLRLDKVLFIPAFIPPHKEVKDNKARLRYKMVALACKENPRFQPLDIEIKRKSISYSVDTLRRLHRKYGDKAELFFIIGSDSLEELERWKDTDKVLKLAKFIVANRPGFPIRKMRRRVKSISIPPKEISSSMIRDRVRRSKSIKYLVPESIRKFIVKYKLYK